MSRPELIIQHTGQIFPLRAQTVTLGSQDDNLIVLADPQVSPHHATIAWQPETGVYVIRDLGSAVGTYVNEVRLRSPQVLRHGDVIRMGNTVMDLRLPPPREATVGKTTVMTPALEEAEGGSRNPLLVGIVVALLAGITIVCVIVLAVLLLTGGKGTPDVIIQSPAAGAQIATGSEIVLQATASGSKDIILLELSVDGALVESSSDPVGTSSLTVRKPWVFTTPGEHEIAAEAFTASGKASRRASLRVNISTGIEPTVTSTAQPTETPTPTLTATPEATATPIPTMSPPQIDYLRANPATIYAGECATLQWGNVTNATKAVIEPGIGGVGTPGAKAICPLETTIYILTATGPGGTSQASATVTVLAAPPDLVVDAIEFFPNPPKAGQEDRVQITVRNAGIGAAGGFDWEWLAGSDAVFDGHIEGLAAGKSTVITVLWTPQRAYSQLSTEMLVDTGNSVSESDEGNNRWVAVVQVVEAPREPQTVILRSDAALDGFRLNDGGGSTVEDILVGNGAPIDPVGELVSRGFMSFDLSGIPAGATIQSVELRFYQKQIRGDPYRKLGNLVLDHVYFGASLDASAYDTPVLDSAVLAQQTSPDAWYLFSDPTFAAWVQSDLGAGRPRHQLRLQFSQETDGDGKEDWITIEPGGGPLGSPNSPQLVVTYLP
jgi:pSer/pThr/pTyr-binding forkhead associated (FHA) protein